METSQKNVLAHLLKPEQDAEVDHPNVWFGNVVMRTMFLNRRAIAVLSMNNLSSVVARDIHEKEKKWFDIAHQYNGVQAPNNHLKFQRIAALD